MARQKTPFTAIRPKWICEAAWREIIDSWENGLSDREAAFRASRHSGQFISEAELKEAIAGDENIGLLRDHLHADITSEAKLNIKESIMQGNVSTSKWYLERKAADEFSTKAAVAFEGGVVELSIEDRKRQMDEFMSQFDGTSNGGDTEGDSK